MWQGRAQSSCRCGSSVPSLGVQVWQPCARTWCKDVAAVAPGRTGGPSGVNSSTSRDRASKRMPGACTAVGHDVGESDVGKAVGEDEVGPRVVGPRVGARVAAHSERRARMAAGVGPMAFLFASVRCCVNSCSSWRELEDGCGAALAVGPAKDAAAEFATQDERQRMQQRRRKACSSTGFGPGTAPKKCDHNPNHYICEPDPRKATENNAGPEHITVLKCRHLCGPPKVSATRAEEIRSHLASNTRSRAFSRRR